MTSSLPTVQRVIQNALEVSQLKYSQHPRPGGAPPALIVELPGERKLKINTILSVGEHSVRVEAFVCRKPDENREDVYRFLLRRNRRLYGVAYTLDNVGDICKGYPDAGAAPCRLSTKHALALTNRGGATAEDVVTLARAVRDGVHDVFGITLKPEPVLIGCML